jgi:hypothetical protein
MHCCLPHPASRICQAAHYADMLVQQWFALERTARLTTRHVRRVGSFRVQEETITEEVLLKLQALFPDVVAIETYDRRVERQTGADWFWIFDFRGTLVPVLVQAKKINGPWDGSDAWTIAFDQSQRQTLVDTANAWNVGSHYCLYAPSWNRWHRPCPFPWPGVSYMHLLAPSSATQGQADHDQLAHAMLPFTCWCCCSDDASDASDVLSISSEKIREGDRELVELLGLAREAETVKGSVVFRMKGDQRG